MKTEIELSRSNVTPAEFLAYVRFMLKKHNISNFFDLDFNYWKTGNDGNFNNKYDDGTHEISVSKPYEMKSYFKTPDGNLTNEICEFQFDDDKKGFGYYYFVNIEK